MNERPTSPTGLQSFSPSDGLKSDELIGQDNKQQNERAFWPVRAQKTHLMQSCTQEKLQEVNSPKKRWRRMLFLDYNSGRDQRGPGISLTRKQRAA